MVIVIIIIAVLWLPVGAFFGYIRATDKICNYISENPNVDRYEIIRIGLGEFFKWMFLGFLSAISFLAWILLNILEKEDKKPPTKAETLEAIILSLIVFVLSVIALELDIDDNDKSKVE